MVGCKSKHVKVISENGFGNIHTYFDDRGGLRRTSMDKGSFAATISNSQLSAYQKKKKRDKSNIAMHSSHPAKWSIF